MNAASWADLRAPDVLDRYAEYLEWTDVRAAQPRAGARSPASCARAGGPVDAVLAVSEWVHDKLTYQRGTTGVHSSAVDAWHAREGVCQDYAHLTLALLRSIGIPARYVSGYLHTKPNAAIGETVSGESHAWIEAWTGGWWGFDPTNDVEIGPPAHLGGDRPRLRGRVAAEGHVLRRRRRRRSRSPWT